MRESGDTSPGRGALVHVRAGTHTSSLQDAASPSEPRAFLNWVAPYAVWVGALVYAVTLTLESIGRYEGFDGSFDGAHYNQLLWLISEGRDPFSTVVNRPLLADHFQPTLVLLTPVYWLGLGYPGILTAQAIAVALTGPALYALARAAGAPPRLAAVPAITWLVCPWVAAANVFEFHPYAFAPVLLVLSVYGAIERHHMLLAVTTVLALGLKEDVALTYVVLGGLIAWRGDRRLGGLIAASAALWFAGAYAVVSSYGPAYENYGRRFAGSRGESVGDALRWLLIHPLEALSDIASQSLLLLVVLVLATLFIALLAPSWLLLSVPTALHNALSAFVPQHHLHAHYQLGTLTGLFIAAAFGVRRVSSLRRWQRFAVPVTVGVWAVATVVGWSLPLGGEELSPRQARDVRYALDRIPPDAPVSATSSLLGHLTLRTEAYSLPEPFAEVDWGSTLSRAEYARRAQGIRYVALRDGDVLPTGGFTPPKAVSTIEPLLHRLGFDEVVRAGDVRILERAP